MRFQKILLWVKGTKGLLKCKCLCCTGTTYLYLLPTLAYKVATEKNDPKAPRGTWQSLDSRRKLPEDFIVTIIGTLLKCQLLCSSRFPPSKDPAFGGEASLFPSPPKYRSPKGSSSKVNNKASPYCTRIMTNILLIVLYFNDNTSRGHCS